MNLEPRYYIFSLRYCYGTRIRPSMPTFFTDDFGNAVCTISQESWTRYKWFSETHAEYFYDYSYRH